MHEALKIIARDTKIIIRKYTVKHKYAGSIINQETPRWLYEYMQGNINMHVALYTKILQDNYKSICKET